MSGSIVFRPIARREFDEAADYYERCRPGLGVRFTVAVRRVLQRIASDPASFPVVFADVREALVRRYPYCVYFRIDRDGILVLAVFHTSRDPDEWQMRP